jgi:hypothetical protein
MGDGSVSAFMLLPDPAITETGKCHGARVGPNGVRPRARRQFAGESARPPRPTGGEVPVPVEDAIRNRAVIDVLFRAADSGAWEKP